MKTIILIILVAVFFLVLGFSAQQQDQTGRYQIVFGTIKKEIGDFRSDKITTELIPICFRLDTLTGQIWEFQDTTTITPDIGLISYHGFKKLPFEQEVYKVPVQKQPK